MVSVGPAGPGATKRCAAFVLSALLALLAPAGALHATMSESCRVPDVYLTMPELDRTEKLVDRGSPVKLVVIGPALDGAEGSAPLERELEHRLPGVNFSLSEERDVSGLAGEDFADLRRLVDQYAPDLVIWQVGTADALAVSDVGAFEAVLDAASRWAEARGVDLVLVDPPFVPHVPHERVYNPYVGAIGGLSADDVPVLRRYAATQFWAIEQEKKRIAPPKHGHCTAEILAEAIFRAVTR